MLDVNVSECHSISNEGWAHVTRVLCDKSSLDTICASNYALTSLGPDYLPEELEELMQMNRNTDKAAVAREKSQVATVSFSRRKEEPFARVF